MGMSDLIERQAAIGRAVEIPLFGKLVKIVAVRELEELPSAQPERQWIPCSNPPKHHRDVIVRGTEAIGNVTVHKVMQWDVDTWRPTDYAPSIIWREWSEI